MMAKVKPGLYKVSELLDKAGFDLKKEAAADYLNGEVDHRRVQVGGLPFDDVEKVIEVPVTANEVVVSLDGKEVAKLEVDLSDEEHQKAREYAFETSGDLEDDRK
jgi:hypothetical protein